MDSGTFIEKVKGEYKFAKELGFDCIDIVVETTCGEYEISEFEDGFICDSLDSVYSDLDEIAGDLHSAVGLNSEVMTGMRIE